MRMQMTGRAMRHPAFALLAMLFVVAKAFAGSHATFLDPLDTPAAKIRGAVDLQRQSLIAVAQAGNRTVAVGLRGAIVISDDGGASWRSASVPVQSDLLAVHFITPEKGWVAGHEGVILSSDDGGETWVKRFDGRLAEKTLVDHYQRRIQAGETHLQAHLAQVKLNTQAGPSLPWLDIWFEDSRVGYAVGSFGMIVRTEDGGKTWLPWLDHVDNPDYLNLNAIGRVGGNLYIAGERGAVFRLDPGSRHFAMLSTGYLGSFFGLSGNSGFLIVYGLRGSAFRSVDGGRTWSKVDMPLSNALTGSAFAEDGKALVLVSEAGAAVVSRDQGKTFQALKVPRPMQFTAVAVAGGSHLLLTGNRGVVRQELPSNDDSTMEKPR